MKLMWQEIERTLKEVNSFSLMHEIIKLKNFVKQHKELHFKDRLKYEEVRNKQYKEDIDSSEIEE